MSIVGFLSHRQSTVRSMAPEVPRADESTPDDLPPTGRRIVVGGGIGAGKSAVCDILARRGFTVVNADEIGHQLLVDDAVSIGRIAELWPEAVVDGTVDRTVLAHSVFSDAGRLAALEQILHPRIVETIEELVESKPGRDVVVEVPLLPLVLDTGYLMSGRFVRVAVVADDRTRLARAVGRGGDAADIERRMRLQATDDEWRAWADIVIDNSGSWSTTEAAVEALAEGMADD